MTPVEMIEEANGRLPALGEDENSVVRFDELDRRRGSRGLLFGPADRQSMWPRREDRPEPLSLHEQRQIRPTRAGELETIGQGPGRMRRRARGQGRVGDSR